MSTVELPGLQGHHPLGFLAACGVLRCCELTRKLEPKLSWTHRNDGLGWVAVLHFSDNVGLNTVIAALIRRARCQKTASWLCWSAKVDNRDKFRRTAEQVVANGGGQAGRESLDFLSSLASDIALNSKGELSSTFLDLTSGNQRLLTSIRDIATELSKLPKRRNDAVFPTDSFRETLCGPWLYRDEQHSLGWDPQTQRLHALRNMLPSDDKTNRSVKGAVFLASQALPLFQSFAVNGKIRTTCFRSENGSDYFVWPIWADPISTNAVRSLLAQRIRKEMRKAGVAVAYKSCRVPTGGAKGDYQIFSNPVEYAWS